jgi:hypothetical protein
VRRSFPPDLALAGLDEKDEPPTRSCGEGVINLSQGFIGMIDGDSIVIGAMKGGSLE